MTLTHREIWTAAHGMVLGAGFLLLFSGTLVGLWTLKPNRLTPSGARTVARLSAAAAWAMALLAFAAVLLGTYVVYPWYRAKPPPNATPDAPGRLCLPCPTIPSFFSSPGPKPPAGTNSAWNGRSTSPGSPPFSPPRLHIASRAWAPAWSIIPECAGRCSFS